jgi:hypothetical protein
MLANKKWMPRLTGLVLLVCGPLAVAAPTDIIRFNGFLTVGGGVANRQVISDVDVVLADGSVYSDIHTQYQSRFGLQISAQVNPDISVTGQLLAQPRPEFGTGQDFNVFADWAYINYRFNDKLSFRAGRIKLPSFLISDYYQVGYAYPWARPPAEMYSANPMTAIDGFDLLIRQNFGDYSLLIQPFYGNNSQDTVVPQAVLRPPMSAPLCNGAPCPPGKIVTVPFSVEAMRGLNLSLSSDIFTLRTSWFQTQVYQSDFGVEGDDGSFSSAGFTMDWKNIVVYTEGFIRVVDGNAGIAFPSQEGGYVTFGYRIGKFLPHATYGWIDPHGSSLGYQLSQRSIDLGLRFELGHGADLKFDVTRMTPEAGNTGLLVGDPNAPGAPDQGSSVLVYSATMDVVF